MDEPKAMVLVWTSWRRRKASRMYADAAIQTDNLLPVCDIEPALVRLEKSGFPATTVSALHLIRQNRNRRCASGVRKFFEPPNRHSSDTGTLS
jgi:hypothetical protein